jgi:hypothetical protein
MEHSSFVAFLMNYSSNQNLVTPKIARLIGWFGVNRFQAVDVAPEADLKARIDFCARAVKQSHVSYAPR